MVGMAGNKRNEGIELIQRGENRRKIGGDSMLKAVFRKSLLEGKKILFYNIG